MLFCLFTEARLVTDDMRLYVGLWRCGWTQCKRT